MRPKYARKETRVIFFRLCKCFDFNGNEKAFQTDEQDPLKLYRREYASKKREKCEIVTRNNSKNMKQEERSNKQNTPSPLLLLASVDGFGYDTRTVRAGSRNNSFSFRRRLTGYTERA